MKTPDEIKKGLECCQDYQSCTKYDETQCPYYDVEGCVDTLLADALALIQQLEAESTRRHEMLIQAYSTIEALSKAGKKAVENLTERCKQLEAERDAMKALFVDSYELCVICKHQVYDDSVCSKVDYCCKLCSPNCACHGCVEASHYEWRGVQKGDMFGLVKDAPAVELMPRWISVEERMPEPKEDVALYIRCGDVSFIRTGWRMRNGQFICPNDSLSGYEVTHWMPLPEPPKEAAP